MCAVVRVNVPRQPVPITRPRPPVPRELRRLWWLIAAIRERGLAA